MRAESRRDLFVSLSLANLCFVRVWGALLNPGNAYFLDHPVSWINAAAASVGMLGLTAVFFAVSRIARHLRPGSFPHRLVSLAFLAAVAVAANAFLQQTHALSFEVLPSPWGQPGLWLMQSVVAVLVAAAWLKWGTDGLARRSTTLILVLLPFTLFTLGQAALVAFRSRSNAIEFHDKTEAPIVSSKAAAPRLLFLVFDALDQQWLSDERPPDLLLPEFDALFKTTVHWQNAYPPSNNTGVSLPALITGRDVVRVRRTAVNELMLSYADSKGTVPWSQEPTLFTRLRGLGRNSALIGWYHPYCRILGDTLARCRWYPYVANPETLKATVPLQIALLVDTIPGASLLGFLNRLGVGRLRGSEDRDWHAAQYSKIHEQALQAALDERFELVFVHYPIPHGPYIYDRTQGTIRLDGKSQYIDNLALADRALSELRKGLSAMGLWDRTALLITSDHWLRRGDWRERGNFAPVIGKPEHRVPLMVRLPGQTEAIVRPEVLRTHAAHYLALAILEGRLRRTTDVEPVLRRLPIWVSPHS
jgi:hypothetical protein